MDKPSFKLVGAPCGQQGQYTFYKELFITRHHKKNISIGDFFFLRIWQDSELVSIGELQLLWTDRVSDQTLVSLRLYFLPENTPDGRCLHGEHEVVALNEKVVVRCEDLVSWLCDGAGWRYGLRAPSAARAGPDAGPGPAAGPPSPENKHTPAECDKPAVVVFSYPRYCRYRALMARLEGAQSAWLRDSLVAALGGYNPVSTNTAVLYCKDTFEYPELEGHEFVCNHLAPRLKGRPRGRRKRAQRSRSHTPSSRSSDSEPQVLPVAEVREEKMTPRRLSLRNGAEKHQSEEEEESKETPEDQRFLETLRQYYIGQGVSPKNLTTMHGFKDLSLRALYESVSSMGGYESVCRHKLWRTVHPDKSTKARDLYLRYLRPYESHELRNGRLKANGRLQDAPAPPPFAAASATATASATTISTTDTSCKEAKPEPPSAPTAEELNREFLESISKEDKPLVAVKPPQLLTESDKHCAFVARLFVDHRALVSQLCAKYNVTEASVMHEVGVRKLSDGSSMLLSELAQRLPSVGCDTSVLKELTAPDHSLSASSVPALVNGHTPPPEQTSRPAGRSSLRAVRVKPTRAPSHTTSSVPLRPGSAGNSNSNSNSNSNGSPPAPPVTNFGIHRPPPPAPPPPPPPHAPPPQLAHNSDEEVVEVPYKPKTPEIIDLDEYPESPQSTKRKKLDILKERGLEVTPVPPAPAPAPAPPPLPHPWPPAPSLMLNPAMQHQIMTQASLFQMYNIIPQNYANGIQPPKVIQSSCIYGSTTPEKTVYGNPKDPFMPPPHLLLGTPIKKEKNITTERTDSAPTRQDVLDLTCKVPTQKPSVEIVRIPSVPSPSKPQNLTKNYSLIDGKAVVGSNLEITLVNPKSQTPPKVNRQPQKRSSNGKFMSTKTPTPPKEFPKDSRSFPSPGAKLSPTMKKPPITIPTYQISKDDISPTSSTGSRESQQSFNKNINFPQVIDMKGPNFSQSLLDIQKSVPMTPYVDPNMYMSALYSSLAGQMDQRQLAMYRDLMANQFRYSSLLGGVATPTTKN